MIRLLLIRFEGAFSSFIALTPLRCHAFGVRLFSSIFKNAFIFFNLFEAVRRTLYLETWTQTDLSRLEINLKRVVCVQLIVFPPPFCNSRKTRFSRSNCDQKRQNWFDDGLESSSNITFHKHASTRWQCYPPAQCQATTTVHEPACLVWANKHHIRSCSDDILGTFHSQQPANTSHWKRIACIF